MLLKNAIIIFMIYVIYFLISNYEILTNSCKYIPY